MTTLQGNEVAELPSPGRARRVLSWVAVPIACLLGIYLLVIPTLLWGYNAFVDLSGARGPESRPRGFVLLVMALAPSAAAALTWFLTASLPLRRERFTLAVLAASAVGFLTLLPWIARGPW